jgi:hypothetical protein
MICSGSSRSRPSKWCRSATLIATCCPTPPTWSPRAKFPKRNRALYRDYREMLKEKDLDIVLVGTPDHWHALAMIAALEAGVDVYVQKPISVDILEGQAMLARRPRHEARGPSRHAAPQHAAFDRSARPDRQGRQIGHGRPGRDLLLLPHARHGRIRPTPRRPNIWITKCGPAPRRCAPTTAWSIRAAGARSWNTATASSATCAFICLT